MDQGMNPTVHECWEFRNEMHIITESLNLYSTIKGWDNPTVGLGLTSLFRMDILAIWTLQMSLNWGKETFAVRGEEYGDVAAVHGILSSTGEVLLGLSYSGREKWGIIWEYLWRFILQEVQLLANIDNAATSGILLQSPNIHSCHYTLTHAPKCGLILAW